MNTNRSSGFQKRCFSKPILLLRSTQIKTYSWDNAQVTLVGNKCDMEDERVITTSKGQKLADQLGKNFIAVF